MIIHDDGDGDDDDDDDGDLQVRGHQESSVTPSSSGVIKIMDYGVFLNSRFALVRFTLVCWTWRRTEILGVWQ